jgi:hypothetical protein
MWRRRRLDLVGEALWLVAVCRSQALMSSVTRRFRRRDGMEMKAISMKAMRCSFDRTKMMFNRR